MVDIVIATVFGISLAICTSIGISIFRPDSGDITLSNFYGGTPISYQSWADRFAGGVIILSCVMCVILILAALLGFSKIYAAVIFSVVFKVVTISLSYWVHHNVVANSQRPC